jgi:hypothetical protein
MIFQADMIQFEGNFERMNRKGGFENLVLLQGCNRGKKQRLYNNKVMPKKVEMSSIVRLLSVLFCCLFIVLPAVATDCDSCNDLMKGFLLAPSSDESPKVSLPKSNQYTYQRHSDNQVSVVWKDSALHKISRECD